MREETLARQKALGVVPEHECLRRGTNRFRVERHAGRPEADPRAADGGHAGFLEHTDHHIGRLVDAGDLEVLDDTLVYSSSGTMGFGRRDADRLLQRAVVPNGAAGLETVDSMKSRIDDFGTPAAYNHYAVGWAHAMDTPYQWTKQVASHWGGTRNGPSSTGRTGSRHVAIRRSSAT